MDISFKKTESLITKIEEYSTTEFRINFINNLSKLYVFPKQNAFFQLPN